MILLSLAITVKLYLFYLIGGLQITVENFVYLYNPLSALFLGIALYRTHLRNNNIALVLALDVFIPVIGPLAIFCFVVLTPVFRLIYKEHDISVYDLPLGEQKYQEFTSVRKSILKKKKNQVEDELHGSLKIESYMDIFQGKDLAAKVNAIEKLTSIADRVSVSILKRCLDLDDYEVRYFANSALEKIEKNIMSTIDLAKDNIERHPMDNVSYNIRGQNYLDAYLLGILDHSMEDFFLENSLYDYLTSLSINNDQSYLYVKITQIYLKLGKYEDLISIAKIALKADLKQEDLNKIKFYLAEASFNTGDFKNVVNLCKEIQKDPIEFELIANSVNWWGNETA